MRDAPNTRGIVKSVFCPTKVAMMLSGDIDLATVPIAEILDLWEPVQFTGDPPPFWVKHKTIFKPSTRRWGEDDLYAEIVEAKPGWVAYYTRRVIAAKAPVFFMTKWWEFRKLFDPVNPPNAWDHVLLDQD